MGGGRGKGKGELGDAWAGLTEPSTDTSKKFRVPSLLHMRKALFT